MRLAVEVLRQSPSCEGPQPPMNWSSSHRCQKDPGGRGTGRLNIQMDTENRLCSHQPRRSRTWSMAASIPCFLPFQIRATGERILPTPVCPQTQVVTALLSRFQPPCANGLQPERPFLLTTEFLPDASGGGGLARQWRIWVKGSCAFSLGRHSCMSHDKLDLCRL